MNENEGNPYQLGLKYITMRHYSGGAPRCADCGCLDLQELQLDHTKGGGQEERNRYSRGRGSGIYYQSLRKRGYPDNLGLEVVCRECHKKRHKSERTYNLSRITFTVEFDYSNPIPDAQEQSLWEDLS